MPLTKGSQPMKPDARGGARLREQMLAAAEADLEPHRVDRRGKQRGESAGAGAAESTARRGSSVSISAAWCGRSRWPLRRPKKARSRAVGSSWASSVIRQ